MADFALLAEAALESATAAHQSLCEAMRGSANNQALLVRKAPAGVLTTVARNLAVAEAGRALSTLMFAGDRSAGEQRAKLARTADADGEPGFLDACTLWCRYAAAVMYAPGLLLASVHPEAVAAHAPLLWLDAPPALRAMRLPKLAAEFVRRRNASPAVALMAWHRPARFVNALARGRAAPLAAGAASPREGDLSVELRRPAA